MYCTCRNTFRWLGPRAKSHRSRDSGTAETAFAIASAAQKCVVWTHTQRYSSKGSRCQHCIVFDCSSAMCDSSPEDTSTAAPAAVPAEREENEQAPQLLSAVPAELTASVSVPQAGASDRHLGKSPILMQVERLKKEQFKIRLERKRISAELRNATKKRQRLKTRAKLLTDGDLLAVVQLRRDEKELAEGNATSWAELTAATETSGTSAASSADPTSSRDGASSTSMAPTPDRTRQSEVDM